MVFKLLANDSVTGDLEQELVNALLETNPRSVSIATAYFTPDGFARISGQIGKAECVRVMLGERPFVIPRGPRDTLRSGDIESEELSGPREEVDWYGLLDGQYPWIFMNHEERKRFLEDNPNADLSHFPLASWEKVRNLVEFLGLPHVEFRRFLADQAGKIKDGDVLSDKTASKIHLHAKTYIFSGGKEPYASVGSSNLTKGGLTDNIELNLTTQDPAIVAGLEDWYDRKWQQSQDCKGEFIKLLEQSVLFGRRFRPWHVFIKALHSAYGRFLAFGLGDEVAARLASYQQEAVARCVTILESHWGVLLCDSVGLGKTHEGLGILEEYQKRMNRDVKVLVICPAQLQENWSLTKLGVRGLYNSRVESMEMLPRLAEIEKVKDADDRSTRLRLLKDLAHFSTWLLERNSPL